MTTKPVVIRNGEYELANIGGEVLAVDISEMGDFDAAQAAIEQVLTDGDLDGPDQMRLTRLVAEAFLAAHGEDTDVIDHQDEVLTAVFERKV